MKRKASILVTAAVCIFFRPSAAQDLLTLEDAVRIGLENNYSIKIAENEETISQTNTAIARSALFPSVGLYASADKQNSNSDLTFYDGRLQSRKGARSTSYNAGIGLDWTIFDGFGMIASLDKYKELENMGSLNARSAVVGTVSDIITTYYDIVRLRQELHTISEALEISRLRVNQANDRYFVGTGSKLELLNSRVDLNEDTTSLLSQQQAIKAAQIRLNEILARDVNTTFDVIDTIPVDMDLRYEYLRNKAIEESPELAIARSNTRVAELEYKEVRSNRYPTVAVNSAYNFVKSNSESGQVLSTQRYGFNYGVSATMNLFSGLLQKKQERNARAAIDNRRLLYDQLLKGVESALSTAYTTYENSKLLMQLEDENRETARQNLDITLEMFRLGNITQLELREAQQNLLLAENRYIEARYQAKVAEISLRELSGSF